MKKYLLGLVLLTVLLMGCVDNKVANKETGDKPTATISSHIHGLAVDRSDSSRIYIATHKGLFSLQNDTTLTRVGDAEDDYMGFSPHPIESNVFFSSGHPTYGGNLGIQKSTNSGQTWKKIANGDEHGPVDFHAMTVSEANPAIIYGWFGGYVYRSENSGVDWQKLPGQLLVTNFGTDPNNESVVYAGTQAGLLKSTDKGNTWNPVFVLSSNEDAVIDIDLDRQTNTMWITTQKQGIMKSSQSTKGELIFETVGALPDNEVAIQIAVDRKNSSVIYATAEQNIYKSTDSGKTWKKLI